MLAATASASTGCTLPRPGRDLGMELEIISSAEAKAMFPLMEEQYFVGALFDPVEGHLDPTSVTNAYTVCARRGGRRSTATRGSPISASDPTAPGT